MSQKRLKKASSKADPFVRKFLGRIPPQTAATFTDTQLTALKQAFGRGNAVDIRLSIPFFKKRFYIVFLLGKEKRFSKK